MTHGSGVGGEGSTTALVITYFIMLHDSTLYVTTTHTNHTIHACTLAAVRAAANAMRAYATTRFANHGLLIVQMPQK